MTDAEKKQAAIRLRQFRREHPGSMDDLASLPAVIIGVDDREIELLNATLADFRHYRRMLERRVARRERRLKARTN